MKSLYTKYISVWKNQENSLDTLYNCLVRKNYKIVLDDYYNITIKNTEEKEIPAFCCHLDTVQQRKPELKLLDDKILMSVNEAGVGGDDKCGIVACLELLERIPCKVIMFREEERGCIGSRIYNNESLKNNRFLIEVDRKGSSDLITSIGGVRLCSKEFEKLLKKSFDGYKPTEGFLTDIKVIEKADINMANVSAGYYYPHTAKEYVDLSVLQKTISCLENFAKKYTEKEIFVRDNSLAKMLAPDLQPKRTRIEEYYENMFENDIINN